MSSEAVAVACGGRRVTRKRPTPVLLPGPFHGILSRGRELAREDLGEQLIAGRGRARLAFRRCFVDEPRSAADMTVLWMNRYEAGPCEDAKMGSDRVCVQADRFGELAGVERSACSKGLEDADAAGIAQSSGAGSHPSPQVDFRPR